jgi:hypothetical protein
MDSAQGTDLVERPGVFVEEAELAVDLDCPLLLGSDPLHDDIKGSPRLPKMTAPPMWRSRTSDGRLRSREG